MLDKLKSLYKKYKYYFPIFLSKKRVELGDGYIIAYTLFELKWLFSIIIYNWKTIKQNRFHSHAFPAIAFLLKGEYEEEVLTKNGVITKKVNQFLKPRWLPRNYIHRILKATPSTYTIVFVGPWSKYWYEYFPDVRFNSKWVKYTWGRKIVDKVENIPKDVL
jgi:hypothetical protein